MTLSDTARSYETYLLGFPNVVGVGTGARRYEAAGVSEECIRVYVSRKLPRDSLKDGEVLPEWIEGYPVVVEEVGDIEAIETPPAPRLSD